MMKLTEITEIDARFGYSSADLRSRPRGPTVHLDLAALLEKENLGRRRDYWGTRPLRPPVSAPICLHSLKKFKL